LDYASVSKVPENEGGGVIFVRVKDHLYAIKNNSISGLIFNNMNDKKAEITTYQSKSDNINIIVSHINDESDLFLLMFQFNPIKNSFPFLFVFSEKIKKSDGSSETFLPNLITCSLLKLKNIDNLICLAVNSESYLGLVTFEVSDSFKFIDYQIIDKGREISSLSSVANENKDEALFCYIDKTQNLKCFKYSPKTKKMSKIEKYLKKCIYYQNYKGIKYVKEKEEYLLYCYQENEYNLAYTKLDKDFNKKDSDGYYTYTIKGCDSIYSSSLIYNKTINKYSLLTNCLYNTDLNLKTSNIEDFSTYVEYFSTIRDLNYISIYSEDDVIKGNTELTKEEIEKHFDEIIDAIEIGKKYEIYGNKIKLYISPIDENSSFKTSYVDLSGCEQKLKRKYNLFEVEILTILQIEFQSNNEDGLTNQIEYEIYDEEKNILDLSLCYDN
jgi:hypothetical protein